MSIYIRRGIPARWLDVRLSQIKPHPGQEEAVRALLALTKDSERGVYLHGIQGRGKSYLASGLVLDTLMRDHRGMDEAQFVPWRALLRNQRAQYRDGEIPDDLMPEILARPLLAIDDLGMGKITELAVDLAEEILDVRYGANLPTLITSNFDVKGLASAMGARVASRVKGACQIVEIGGKDHR